MTAATPAPEADLYPTPTRVQLLGDILSGFVSARRVAAVGGGPSKNRYTLDIPEEKTRNVTAQMEEFIAAGWAVVGTVRLTGDRHEGERLVELLVTGEDVLRASGAWPATLRDDR